VPVKSVVNATAAAALSAQQLLVIKLAVLVLVKKDAAGFITDVVYTELVWLALVLKSTKPYTFISAVPPKRPTRASEGVMNRLFEIE
jgi:hypothetical protein